MIISLLLHLMCFFYVFRWIFSIMDLNMNLHVTFKQINARRYAKLTYRASMWTKITYCIKIVEDGFFYYERRALALSILIWFIRVLSIMINALKNKDCRGLIVGILWPAQSVERTKYTLELSLLKWRNVMQVLCNSLIL